MYSPKIDEPLIPELYRLAKRKGQPMTRIVNRFIKQGLETEKQQNNKEEPSNEKETGRNV